MDESSQQTSISVSELVSRLTSTSRWSYRGLAAELGCDHTYLHNIATGRQKPPRETALYERIAVIAGVEVSSITEWRRADIMRALEDDSQVDRIFASMREPDPVAIPVASGIVLDEEAYGVIVDGVNLYLTFMEFELLRRMVHSPMRVFTREVLLANVWGHDHFGGARTVDVHIRRIRMKLGARQAAYVETVRNVGYRYNPDAT